MGIFRWYSLRSFLIEWKQNVSGRKKSRILQEFLFKVYFFLREREREVRGVSAHKWGRGGGE